MKLSERAANVATDAVCALLDGGCLRVYSGTQPASRADAITDQKLLLEFRFSDQAFSPAAGGIARSKSLGSVISKVNGTATWFRAFERDGESAVFDGSAGVGDVDLPMSRADVQIGGTVAVDSVSYEGAPL